MTMLECPFCCAADAEVSNRPRPSRQSWNVECNSCGSEGPSSFDSPEDAIELWNRRALSTVTPAYFGRLVGVQEIEQAYETAVSQGEAGYPAAAFRAGYRAALEAQAAELAAVKENCETVCNSYADENQRLYDRAERAEAALAAERAALAETRKALEPFAKEADGRKSKGLLGGVIFTQDVLLTARRALTGGQDG